MKIVRLTLGAAALCLLSGTSLIFSQDAASAPNAAPTNVPGGARRGGGNRGAPLSAADQAEIARLDAFPAWTPGAGDGCYFVGPAYAPAPEQTPKEGVPKGRVESFTLNAADSKYYPDTGLRGATPTRRVTVYIPSQYVPGTPAPLIVSADAYGARNNQLPNILDNMIADHRLPAIVAVMIANGGGDGGGSERGLEYDTVSGKTPSLLRRKCCPRLRRTTA